MKSITGFVYFATFAVVTSVAMSVFFAIEFPIIVPYFKRRGMRGTKLLQVGQAALFILLSACISFLTWAGVEGNVHPLYTVSTFGLIVIFFLFIAPHLFCDVVSQNNGKCRVQNPRYDTRLEFDGTYPCEGNKKGNCGAYKARINVNWGNEWSCPDNPNVWCDTWITERECIIRTEETVATQVQFVDNFAKLESCIMDKYGVPAVGDELGKERYPELEGDWPTVQFLGTCNSSCSTRPLSTRMYQYVERIRLAGLCLSCIGAVIFAIYYCAIFGKVMRDCFGRLRNPTKIVFSLRSSIVGRFLQSEGTSPDNRSTTETSTEDLVNREEGRRATTIAAPESNGDGSSNESREVGAQANPPPMAQASILGDDDDSSGVSSDEYSAYGDESFHSSGSSRSDESDNSSWDETCQSKSSVSMQSCDEDSCDRSELSGDRSQHYAVKPGTNDALDEVDIDV